MYHAAPRRLLLKLSVLVLGVFNLANAQSLRVDWKAAAQGDIERAYQLSVENHPGIKDPSNPEFAKQLSRARSKGLALARQVTTPGGYSAALGAFSAEIGDGHAGAYVKLPAELERAAQWPGFVAAWRGNALFVFSSEAGGPTVGALVVSCDGVDIVTLVKRNVFAFVGRSAEKGLWWLRARNVFVDAGNPFIRRPQSCVFETEKKRATIRLSWRPMPAEALETAKATVNGDRLPLGMIEREPGVFWIAMPTYQPNDTEVKAYRDLYAEVERRHPDLEKAKAIVLDLRHNQGGSSSWSNELAVALWGKAFIQAEKERYFAKVEIWWRATEGHEKHLLSLADEMRAQGRREAADTLVSLTKELHQAIELKRDFVVKKDIAPRPNSVDAEAASSPKLKTPVYVIVPGQCASACLDAVDVFKLAPNVRLIGAPSSADSTYMEVRTEQLPSGYGYVLLPHKIWVHRPRGNGQYYTPDIEMNVLDWSTESFQRKIAAL
jgi:Peptidase family S41